jgi:hypothetical protein
MRKSFLIAAALVSTLCGRELPAQEKLAEGEYQVQLVSAAGVPKAKTATRWVLYSNTSGGYRLRSEYVKMPAGMRVVQVEELDRRLAPTMIGYELYRNNEKEPGIVVRCEVLKSAVTCGGEFEGKPVPASSPYKQEGAFWLWMEGLFALDMPWLIDGTVNMAHLEKGTAKVPTISVLGGTAVLIGDAVNVAKLKAVRGLGEKLTVIAPDKPVNWDLYSDEESLLELVDTTTVDVDGTKVAAKHYTFKNGGQPMDLWITESGLLIKMSGTGDRLEWALANYKQYKKLIPELPIEKSDSLPTQETK